MMHDKKTLIGLIIAAVVVLGLVLWYMATHPAPAYAPEGQSAQPGVSAEPEQLTDSGEYYEVEASYPSATPLRASAGAEADARAVASMKAFIESEIADFKKNNVDTITPDLVEMMDLGGDRKFALDVEYEMHESPATISYLFQIYADTGGAHPNTYYRTFTFDKGTGAELALKDLFAPGAGYLAKLSSVSRAQLPVIIASREQVSVEEVDTSMLTEGTKPDAASFQTFFVDGSDLVLVFPPYQVGPYVLGTVLLPVPLASLSDLLAPAYR
jgi:hypothetical protein